jgi:hypothetical protein
VARHLVDVHLMNIDEAVVESYAVKPYTLGQVTALRNYQRLQSIHIIPSLEDNLYHAKSLSQNFFRQSLCSYSMLEWASFPCRTGSTSVELSPVTAL